MCSAETAGVEQAQGGVAKELAACGRVWPLHIIRLGKCPRQQRHLGTSVAINSKSLAHAVAQVSHQIAGSVRAAQQPLEQAGWPTSGSQHPFSDGTLGVKIETPVSDAGRWQQPADDRRQQDAEDRVGAYQHHVWCSCTAAPCSPAPRRQHPRGIQQSAQPGSLPPVGTPNAANRHIVPGLPRTKRS